MNKSQTYADMVSALVEIDLLYSHPRVYLKGNLDLARSGELAKWLPHFKLERKTEGFYAQLSADVAREVLIKQEHAAKIAWPKGRPDESQFPNEEDF